MYLPKYHIHYYTQLSPSIAVMMMAIRKWVTASKQVSKSVSKRSEKRTNPMQTTAALTPPDWHALSCQSTQQTACTSLCSQLLCSTYILRRSLRTQQTLDPPPHKGGSSSRHCTQPHSECSLQVAGESKRSPASQQSNSNPSLE